MKKITIPISFGQPSVKVSINDKAYLLETGKEIEVEDFIAEFMERTIRSQEPVMAPTAPGCDSAFILRPAATDLSTETGVLGGIACSLNSAELEKALESGRTAFIVFPMEVIGNGAEEFMKDAMCMVTGWGRVDLTSQDRGKHFYCTFTLFGGGNPVIMVLEFSNGTYVRELQ